MATSIYGLNYSFGGTGKECPVNPSIVFKKSAIVTYYSNYQPKLIETLSNPYDGDQHDKLVEETYSYIEKVNDIVAQDFLYGDLSLWDWYMSLKSAEREIFVQEALDVLQKTEFTITSSVQIGQTQYQSLLVPAIFADSNLSTVFDEIDIMCEKSYSSYRRPAAVLVLSPGAEYGGVRPASFAFDRPGGYNGES